MLVLFEYARYDGKDSGAHAERVRAVTHEGVLAKMGKVSATDGRQFSL